MTEPIDYLRERLRELLRQYPEDEARRQFREEVKDYLAGRSGTN
jgi:hypothetical protein